MSANQYGFGEHPPYSLYQADNGKWGLIDGTGARLDAVFDRIDEDRFSKVPWEVVTFDPKEGFSLLAWYDPCEVWFSFTWEDSAYPEEFDELLWKKSKHDIAYYRNTLYELMADENQWLIEDILNLENLDRSDDDEFYRCVGTMLSVRPELADAYEIQCLTR